MYKYTYQPKGCMELLNHTINLFAAARRQILVDHDLTNSYHDDQPVS